MKKILLIVALSFVLITNAQIQFGGIPLSFNNLKNLDYRSSFTLSNKDNYINHMFISQCDEDSFLIGISEQGDSLFGTYDCGYKNSFTEAVSIDYIENAVWDTIGDQLIGRFMINADYAQGISIRFNDYVLNKQDMLYVYSTNDKSEILGAFMSFNQLKSGGFYHAPIESNSIIIELNTDINSIKNIRLSINQIDLYYPNYFDSMVKSTKERPRLWCHNNVNCTEWDFMCNEIRATVQLSFRGGGRCSGVLINNSCFDFEPYILTAHHCFKGDEDEIDWERSFVRFNFQNPNCDDEDMGNLTMTVMGLEVVAASGYTSLSGGSHDLAILRMTNPPPAQYNAYYAGWNVERNKDNIIGYDKVVGIHHPRSTEKSISQGRLVNRFINPIDWATPAIWTVEWYDGTIQTGSSGSPLFDGQHFVIGALSGGVNLCPVIVDGIPVLSDTWYGKLGYWNDGIDILRPCNQHLRAIGGADPNRYCLPLIDIYGQTIDPALWRADKEQILVQADIVRIGEIANTTFESGSDYIFQGESRVEITFGGVDSNRTWIQNGATIRITTAPCVYTEEQCGFNYFAKNIDVEEDNTDEIQPMETNKELKAFPNPFENDINLEFELVEDAKISASLYNIQGQLIQEFNPTQTFEIGKHSILLQTEQNLSKGLYVVKFCVNGNCESKQLIKE